MTTISPIYIKSASAIVIAGVLDRFICGEQDMMQNAYFGVSTGLGISLGSYISSMVPAILPDSAGLYTGSALPSRRLSCDRSWRWISRYLCSFQIHDQTKQQYKFE